VLVSSIVLILLFWLWKPIPGIVWSVTNPVGATLLLALFWLGWGIVLLSTFLIDHFDLFGLRQVFSHYRGREVEPVRFKTPCSTSRCDIRSISVSCWRSGQRRP